MPQVLSTVLTIGAAVSGFLFFGYCVYFDAQRRASPNYKQNVKEKRRQKRLEQYPKLPDLRDQGAVQSYYMSQLVLGEQLLDAGEPEDAVEHLCNAVAICATTFLGGSAQILLAGLQQNLPPNIFLLLVQRLPAIEQTFRAHAARFEAASAATTTMDPSSGGGDFGGSSISPSTIRVIEDDLE